ncbi:MAG: hypothetical protein H5U05_06640 [Candidatus Aminicenantes bacterium]|nr:hypothetical protein [Candidatus Aminicenantes bacterium]
MNISSIVSIIVGFFAILISVLLYIASNKESAKIKESSDKIESEVKNLGSLFEYLRADLFSLTRDIISYAWTKPLRSSDANKEMKDNKNEINIHEKKIKELNEKILNTLDKLEKYVKENKPIWAKKAIISMIGNEGIIAQELFSEFLDLKRFDAKDFFDSVFSLKEEGILYWEGKKLEPDSLIKIKKNDWKYL